MSEFTPGNGVNSDSLKISIQILIAKFYDFWNFKKRHHMMIFLYETGSEATKITTLKIFWKIKLFFWPFWRLVEWRHFRALAVVIILIFNQCNSLFLTSATCRFQKTQKIRKIYEGPREISERVKILLLSEFTLVSEITPVDGRSSEVGWPLVLTRIGTFLLQIDISNCLNPIIPESLCWPIKAI